MKSAKQLDFYESMYHFKKMFPKFDSDVIETVLRSNNGAVDKTIDALLQMTIEDESIECVADSASSIAVGSSQASNFTSSVYSMDSYSDLPPSYNEFMSSIMVSGETSSTNALSSLNNNSKNVNNTNGSGASSINTKNTASSSNDWDMIRKKSDNYAVSLVSEIETPEVFFSSVLKNTTDPTFRSKSPSELKLKLNSILVGELPKDFLRIKLTSEQMRKVKNTIKKAKRNEITAMLNDVGNAKI